MIRLPSAWRARLGPLSERNFRLFFLAWVTSIAGSAMVPVALTFAVLDEGRRVGAVSEVLAAETVPLVVLLVFGGVLADRIPRNVSMVGADLARCASQTLLAVLLLTGTPPLWVLMALSAVLGAGQAFFNPAMTGLMPQIVDPERLQQANALRAVATSTGTVVGPALAGVIVALGGPGWAIAFDAATYAVSAGCLLALTIPPRPEGEHASVMRELIEGWHAFTAHSWLWGIVAQFSTYNALSVAPFLVLGAVVSRGQLGGAAAWGTILACFGAGSVLGAIVSARVHPRRPLVLGVCCAAWLALPVGLLAVPAPVAPIAIATGIAGLGLSIFDTLWETSLQRHVPHDVLSRVSAYDWFGSAAFTPIGYILVGPLAAALGVRTTLLFAAAWAVASCAGALLVPGIRGLTDAG